MTDAPERPPAARTAPPPAHTAAGALTTRNEGAEGTERGDGGGAMLQAIATGCSTMIDVPHSYFFFCAFSAALVILPVVTSLKVTL
ncbi:hypothetical protein RR46_10696 [Papilio xuthus]|uniref:Uncharacterized protein n=1 Tax=Papilio xuthus TaxID=66420 RepID=A0A194PJ34_PAPXU|nr:hypothetical protein RR46_10696 [Papilio xuthus]